MDQLTVLQVDICSGDESPDQLEAMITATYSVAEFLRDGMSITEMADMYNDPDELSDESVDQLAWNALVDSGATTILETLANLADVVAIDSDEIENILIVDGTLQLELYRGENNN